MQTNENLRTIATILKDSAEKMVENRMLWKSREIKTTPQEFGKMVMSVFNECLQHERELYLEQITQRLVAVTKERKALEKAIESIQTAPQATNEQFFEKNEKLRAEISQMEEELKMIQMRQTRKDKAFRDKIRQKNAQVNQTNLVIEEMLNFQQALAQQLAELKAATVRMQRGQIRLGQRARVMVETHIQETMEDCASNFEILRSQRFTKIADTLSDEKDELNDVRRQGQAVLDVLEELGVKVCAIDDLPRNLDRIKDSITSAVERRRDNVVDGMRDDILRAFPGIKIGKGNIADVIESYVADQIKLKEKECEEVLRKGEQREKKLRQQLNEAIGQIERLQGVRGDDMAYLADLEMSRHEYEEQQRKLDEQMSALHLGKLRC